MTEKVVVHSASRSIHFGKRWVFSFVFSGTPVAARPSAWSVLGLTGPLSADCDRVVSFIRNLSCRVTAGKCA